MRQCDVADLEISVKPRDVTEPEMRATGEDTTAYLADVYGIAPGSTEKTIYAQNIALQIRRARLDEVALDSDEYGQRLAEMLFADKVMKEAFQQANHSIKVSQKPKRIRLNLISKDLHALRWETIYDPITGIALATSERTLFTRYIDGPEAVPLTLTSKAALKAVIAVASPSDGGRFGLTPIDTDGEIDRAKTALDGIDVQTLRGASLNSIAAALRDEPQLLYLACHGRFRGGNSYLLLETADGTADWVSGADFAAQVGKLKPCPALIVLAACQSAGQSHDDGALSAVGPRLLQAGVGAVVAMQGNVSTETVAQMMPVLFSELMRNGRIDRAMAAARSAVRGRPDWWMPVLYMRTRYGKLWQEQKLIKIEGPRTTPLLGRDGALEEVMSRLCASESAGKTLAIYGLPGVGKTDVVRTIGNHLDMRDYFEDGILYAELGQKPNCAATLQSWIATFQDTKPDTDDTDELVKMLRAHLERRRALLIIDDVWESSLKEARILRGCAQDQCRVLISSRHRAVTHELASGDLFLDLGILDPEAALQLLRDAAADPKNNNQLNVVDQEPEVAKKFVEAIGRLPLALRLAGAYLREDRIESPPVATLYTSWQRELEELQDYEERQDLEGALLSLSAIIGLSYRALPDAETQRAAAALGAFGATPLNWDWTATTALWNADKRSMKRWERSLVSHGLMAFSDIERRYSMHQTIGAFLGQHTEPEDRQRHARYYLELVEAADAKLRGPEQVEAAELLDQEFANIRVALGWALESSNSEIALRFGGRLWRFWLRRGYFTEGRTTYEDILKLPFSPEDEISPVLAQARADALSGAGVLAENQGDVNLAEQYHQESLRLRRMLSRPKDIAASLNSLGRVMTWRNAYDQAARYYTEALEYFASPDDDGSIAIINGNLGHAEYAQGLLEAARTRFMQSVADLRRLDDTDHLAIYLTELGTTLLHLGEYEDALAYYQESLALNITLKDRPGEASLLINLARLAAFQDNTIEAYRLIRESLPFCQEHGDDLGVAEALEVWAIALIEHNQFAFAACLLSAIDRWRTQKNQARIPFEETLYQQRYQNLRQQMNEAAFEVCWAEGQSLELDQAVAEIMNDTRSSS